MQIQNIKSNNANNQHYIFRYQLILTAEEPLRFLNQAAHPSTIVGGGFTLLFFVAERQAARKLWIPILPIFGLTRRGIEPALTVLVADVLFPLPLTKANLLILIGYAYVMKLRH